MTAELDFVREGTSLTHDSALAAEFPEWTRAHIDVVLPGVFTNLGWTVAGPAFEWTHRRLVSRRLAVMRNSKEATWRHIARIDGYAHINVTSARALAARMPGVSPSKVDEEMGLAGLRPLSDTTWRDRLWYPLAILGAVRMRALLPWDLWRQRRAVRALLAADFSSLTDEQLIAWVEKARHRLVAVCLAHYVARLFSTPTMEKLEAVSPDRDLALGLLADVEDLEASAPTLAMYEFAQLGTVDDAAIEAFLDRFGHRGTSELDPGAPVWADDGDRVRRRVRELAAAEPGGVLERRTNARVVAERRLAELAWPARLRLRIVASACRATGRLGERTKDNLARATHVIRRALQELARRADLDYEDAVLLSWDELAQWVRGEPIAAELEIRRGQLAEARGVRPPLYRRTDTGETVPYPAARHELRGIAASPGVATGRSVIVRDPLESVEDGEILVAYSTDTSWTHLFLSHDAVVTQTGDLLSHSSIVARDLGIPAVVAVPDATTEIRPGQSTTVNGNEGLVITS